MVMELDAAVSAYKQTNERKKMSQILFKIHVTTALEMQPENDATIIYGNDATIIVVMAVMGFTDE